MSPDNVNVSGTITAQFNDTETRAFYIAGLIDHFVFAVHRTLLLAPAPMGALHAYHALSLEDAQMIHDEVLADGRLIPVVEEDPHAMHQDGARVDFFLPNYPPADIFDLDIQLKARPAPEGVQVNVWAMTQQARKTTILNVAEREAILKGSLIIGIIRA